MGTEAASGGMERTGVVLSALDEFSGNIQKYIADLRKVQAAGQQLSDQEKDAAASAAATSSSFVEAGESSASYAREATALVSQLANVSNTGHGVSAAMRVVSTAMHAGLGPIGLSIAALAGLTTVLAAVLQAEGKVKQQLDESSDALTELARTTGIANDAELITLRIRRATIEGEQAKAQALLESARAGKDNRNVWEMLASINHTYGSIVDKNEAIMAKESVTIRQNAMELQALEEALRGGTDAEKAFNEEFNRARDEAVDRYKKEQAAAKAAADAYIAGVASQREAIQSLLVEQLTLAGNERAAAILAADYKIRAIAKELGDERLRAEQIRIIRETLNLQLSAIEAEADEARVARRTRLLKKLNDLEEKAAKDAKALRDAADKEEKAAEQRRAMYIATSMTIVGRAVGEAAAGNVRAWKQAAAQSIQIAAAEATKWLAIQAAKNIANPGLAALYMAGIVAVNAIASKAEADFNRMPAGDTGGGRGSAPTGPTILVSGYDPAQRASAMSGGYGSYSEGAFAPTINLAVHGDAPADKVALSLRTAQEFLDKHMPEWQARNRRLGRRL